MIRSVSVCLLIFIASALQGADVWSQFRGPEGQGRSDEQGLPTVVSDATTRWKATLPAAGESSPVVWKDRVFVTSATPDGKNRFLTCLAVTDGRELWQKKIAAEPQRLHKKNSYAVTTPCVDANGVYMTYSSGKAVFLKAWDHSGKELWEYAYGEQVSAHGFGSSPAVANGILVTSVEQMGSAADGAESLVRGIRASDGSLVWEAPIRSIKVSYITPAIRNAEDGARFYLSSQKMGLYCIAAETGEMVWHAAVLDKRTVGVPQFYKDLVIASCGSGGRGSILAAVRDGGAGDVAETHVAYRVTSGAPYVPTPLIVGDRMYIWSDRGGVVRCLEAGTGKVLWTGRAGGDASGSPVYADGHIYMIDESGMLIVLKAGDKLDIVAQSPIGERSLCTPAIAGRRIYLRAGKTLLALGNS